jgi:hypothetical protein
LTFTNSLSTSLDFTAFSCMSRSAEEGRDEKKCPTDEGDEVELSEKKRPTAMKILVLIVVIGSVIPILAGVMMLTGGAAYEGYFMQKLLSQILPTFYLSAGVIGLLVAWGLWIGNGWAWIIGIILHVIGIIMDLVSLPTGIVGVVIDGIVVYLLLRPDTRRFCGK